MRATVECAIEYYPDCTLQLRDYFASIGTPVIPLIRPSLCHLRGYVALVIHM